MACCFLLPFIFRAYGTLPSFYVLGNVFWINACFKGNFNLVSVVIFPGYFSIFTKKMKKSLFVLLLIILVAVSLFPRGVEVLNNNYIFPLDSGRDYMAVKNIVVDHKPTLIGAQVGSGMAGLQGLFHGPFYFYLLSIPFILFQGDPYGGVLVMYLFGLLTIVLGFFLGRKTLGLYGGLILAFLVAFSPPIIAQSRFIWSPHVGSFFILLSFYFTYLSYQKKKLYLFLAAFFAGFLYNFEFAIALPLSVSLFLYMFFLLRKNLKSFSFVLLGFFAAYLPLILFDLKHGLQAISGMGSYFSHPRETSFKIDTFAFYHNLIDTFPKQEVIPWAIVLFALFIGLVYFLLKEKRASLSSFIYYLLSTWIITFAVSSLVKTHIFEYYLIHLNFINMFLFAYVIVGSYEKNKILFKILFTIIFVAFFIFGSLNSIQNTLRDFNDPGGMVKIKGKLEAIDYIYKDAKGKEFGLLVFAPPIYTYPYDYLIWWRGTKKYNYVPHSKKTGTFYLLIEKDTDKWWTYKGWLETVIKTGKVVKTKELPSGFIIQKRID